jgi:hypothetical protein
MIRNDSLQLLQSLPTDLWVLPSLVVKSVEYGSLECLRYAHENGCPWHPMTTYAAAKSGSLEYLKYTHENGCPWDRWTTAHAAASGSLECLRYAYENGCP